MDSGNSEKHLFHSINDYKQTDNSELQTNIDENMEVTEILEMKNAGKPSSWVDGIWSCMWPVLSFVNKTTDPKQHKGKALHLSKFVTLFDYRKGQVVWRQIGIASCLHAFAQYRSGDILWLEKCQSTNEH